MERKNVALVVETTFPPVSRANLRLYKLSMVLVRKGHRVWMVSPSQTFFNKGSGNYEGIEIKQFRGLNRLLYARIRTLVRAYHFMAAVAMLVSMNIRHRLDVIHAWNPLAGLAAAVAGRIIGKSVYIDFTDFYSDIAIDDSPALVRVLRWIELFVLKRAEKIIVVSEVMVERLMMLGVDKNKIQIVPDGTSPKVFSPNEDGTSIRQKLKIGDRPVIIYHGDIKHLDGVDILLDAFRKVLEKVPDAVLLILGGGGSYFDRLKETAQDLMDSGSAIFTGWVPHSDVPKYICASDVGAMTLRPTINHQCYLSFKLFEYWGCAKPVVLTRLNAISRIMQDGVHGIQVEFDNADRYADAFVSLLLDRQKAREIGLNGRKLVIEQFDWDKIMEKEACLYGG